MGIESRLKPFLRQIGDPELLVRGFMLSHRYALLVSARKNENGVVGYIKPRCFMVRILVSFVSAPGHDLYILPCIAG